MTHSVRVVAELGVPMPALSLPQAGLAVGCRAGPAGAGRDQREGSVGVLSEQSCWRIRPVL